MKFSPEVVATFAVLLGSANAYTTNFPTADHTHTEVEHIHQVEHTHHQADHLHQADHFHQTDHVHQAEHLPQAEQSHTTEDSQQHHSSTGQQQYTIARRHAEAMKASILSQMNNPKNQRNMNLVIARRDAEAMKADLLSKMKPSKNQIHMAIARRDAEAKQVVHKGSSSAKLPGRKDEDALGLKTTNRQKNAMSMLNIARRDAEAEPRYPGGGVESGLAPPKGKNARFMKIGRRDAEAEAEAKNIHIPGHHKLSQRDIDEVEYFSILARDIEADWESLDAMLQIREKPYGKPRIGILAKKQRRDLMASDEFEDGFERRDFWEDDEF